jgi:predicted O-linked N-acetylglucosamine transferase (SPINDLY family)
LLLAGRLAEAASLLDALCVEEPQDGRFWFLLGTCRHGLRDLAGAFAAFERSLALESENLQAAQAAVAVLCDRGLFDIALARAEDLVTRHPRNTELHFTAGVVCEALGNHFVALGYYDRALELDPECIDALQNRGVALTNLGRVDDAVENNRRFVSLCPDRVDAHFNLAESCLAARRYDEATRAAQGALAIDSGHALARLDLGLALAADGRIEDARVELKNVLSRNDPAVRRRIEMWAKQSGIVDQVDAATLFQPEDLFLLMGCERLERCEWSGFDAFVARCSELIGGAPPESLRSRALAFKVLYLPLAASLQKIVADRVAESIARSASPIPAAARQRPASVRRLRIGYLSARFGRHATAHLTRSIYGAHDRSGFEICGYALEPDDGSSNFRSIAASCDRFVDVHGLLSDEIASRIASDGIDILVDLNGYTQGGRPEVLARRPAPVQVSYLAYPGTLGGTLADYLVLDDTVAPDWADEFYSEKVVRLPHCYLPASHRSLPVLPTPPRSIEGLPERGLVFCAFHRHEKIDPATFAAWMRILRATPQSVLWLTEGAGQANLLRHAKDADVDPTRLVFAKERDFAEHIARQRLADLFLDTPYYNAHTMGADALWAGVPLVTTPGKHLVSRVGASLLRAVGLEELIVDALSEYEAVAVDLATHPDKLRRLKERLDRNRETYPVFDTARLVRNLERAYQRIWHAHEAGDRPRPFRVEDAN